MRKIVIIKGTDMYSDYNDDSFIVKHADPQEVTDEDYTILRNYLGSIFTKDGYSYRMIEYAQPAEAVDVLKLCREKQAVADEQARKRRADRDRQLAKSEAKKLEDKRKQFEKLKKELGEK